MFTTVQFVKDKVGRFLKVAKSDNSDNISCQHSWSVLDTEAELKHLGTGIPNEMNLIEKERDGHWLQHSLHWMWPFLDEEFMT